MDTKQNIFRLIPNLIQHKIAASASDDITAGMFEYLLAGNGLFVRAKRKEFSVCLPLLSEKIRGLPDVSSGIRWHCPPIPADLWRDILANARIGSDSLNFREDVFVIFRSDETNRGCQWSWRSVGKERSWGRTIADDSLGEYRDAAIEIHTHPEGVVYFSQADDRDENGKFRIFGILVDIHTETPKIRLRCGIYDHFIEIPAELISRMPEELFDLNSRRQIISEA